LMHRPLPKGSRIKRAWILERNRGGHWSFELQLTVQSETEFKRARAKRHKRVEVELCAQRRENGSVVAARWQGSDGESGEIDIDARTVEALGDRDDFLESAIDDHFNAARRAIRLWVHVSRSERRIDLRVRGEMATVTLPEALNGSGSWKTPGRLCWIVRSMVGATLRQDDVDACWKAWKAARLPHGLDLHGSLPGIMPELRAVVRGAGFNLEPEPLMALWLEWWRRKNEHLRKLRANRRYTAQQRRVSAGGEDNQGSEGFRVVAARLAGRYQDCEVVTPTGELKKKARKREGKGTLDKVVTRAGKIAAGSILKTALENAFTKPHYSVRKVPAVAMAAE